MNKVGETLQWNERDLLPILAIIYYKIILF